MATNVTATPNNYVNVHGAQTNNVHSGACVLQSVVVNTPGTLCTVYDSTSGSGSVVAIINTATSVPGTTAVYNVKCSKGITVVTTGAATDITVTYGSL